MVITINNTLTLITRKKNYVRVDPSLRMTAEVPSAALSSLAICTVFLGGVRLPVNSQSDSLMYLSDVIHPPPQPHLQATKQQKITAQPPLNPARVKAEAP